MLCPVCAQEDTKASLRVVKTTTDHLHVTRFRRCDNDPNHEVRTQEMVAPSDELATIVRDDGSKRAFDRSFLRNSILAGAGHRLTVMEVDDLITQALTRARRVQPPGQFEFNIHDRALLTAVSDRLGEVDELAQVLYNLSTRGGINSEHKNYERGFLEAIDFHMWMSKQGYLKPVEERDPRKRFASWRTEFDTRLNEIEVDNHARADGYIVRPTAVVKRKERREAFDVVKFRNSLERAMLNRRYSDRLVAAIETRALIQLSGQHTVLSGQLVAHTAYALRSVDEIAYLRWVAFTKPLQSIEEVGHEVEALTTTPNSNRRQLNARRG